MLCGYTVSVLGDATMQYCAISPIVLCYASDPGTQKFIERVQ